MRPISTNRRSQHDLSMAHGDWLTEKFPNVTHVVELDKLYDKFWLTMISIDMMSEHAFANPTQD